MIRKTKLVDRMITRGTVLILIIAIVAALIIGILHATKKIDTAQTLEIAVLTTLVLVTAWYAKQTASMAEEMKEQRYAALKPVIDIQKQVGSGLDFAREEIAAHKGELPQVLPCILRNIGVGPVIEVYSFIEDVRGKRRQWDFGALPIAIGEEEMGCTPEMRFFLEQRDDHRVLVAYHKDVYGNLFESSREVGVDKERDRLEIGPLKIRKLSRGEPIK